MPADTETEPLKVWEFPERDCLLPWASTREWDWLRAWADAERRSGRLTGPVHAVRTLEPAESGKAKPSYAVFSGQCPDGMREARNL
jgi:hypothetical protein